MKTLKIPFCPDLSKLKLEEIAESLEEKGVCGSIDSANWLNDFPYKPITTFYLARTNERLYIKYAVKGNLLRAVHELDGTARAGHRLDARRRPRFPPFGDGERRALLSGQRRVGLVEILVGNVVARGGQSQGGHRHSSAHDQSGEGFLHGG